MNLDDWAHICNSRNSATIINQVFLSFKYREYLFPYNYHLLTQIFSRFSSNVDNYMLSNNNKELKNILTPCWAPHGTRRKMTGKAWCSGAVVQWLSVLHNFIQRNLNSGSVQVQILLAACQRFAMVRISDNGPGWK